MWRFLFMNKTWFQVWDCGYFSASPRRIPPQNRYITRSKSQSVIVGLSTRGRCFSQYYIGYYRTIKTSITDLERSLISQRQSNNDKSSIAIHELLLRVWVVSIELSSSTPWMAHHLNSCVQTSQTASLLKQPAPEHSTLDSWDDHCFSHPRPPLRNSIPLIN